jgi:hypothetical protein
VLGDYVVAATKTGALVMLSKYTIAAALLLFHACMLAEQPAL